jgi:hypothetical protein
MTPKQIQKHCDTARKFYEEKPGLVGPSTVDDLYTAIRRLAECVEWQRNEIERLRANG